MFKLKFEEIKTINEISFLGDVYDIEVEDDSSFVLGNGNVVHNSACTTRVKTGVGYPQLSLILDSIKFINDNSLLYKNKILICSDGGCKKVGDVSKAFVAGADFVMLGGMLSGHEENPGHVEEFNGKKYKRFSGMAAKESQQEGVPDYGTEEGKTVMIPYKGNVINTLLDIEGGLRSTCTYTNSSNVSALVKSSFILSNEQENKIFS